MKKQTGSVDHQVHLFTLRIWSVEEGDAAPQWRSRLQNLHSGEVHFCKDLESLMAQLEKTLNEPQAGSDVE